MRSVSQPIAARRSRARSRHVLAGALLAAVLGLSGCASLGHLAHLARGQLGIWRASEPIDAVLAEGDVDPAVASSLRAATEARDFAFAELALPDNGSFRNFAQLDREFVVWNVFAAPELSLEPVESCYPLAGCFSYRGFFSEDRAERHAARLRARGLDVYVGGVAAYSTLGWLDDPLLSSTLARGEVRTAEIIFHELAHERLYVADDTTFNESFAMTVANRGLELWLARRGGDFSRVLSEQARDAEFVAMLLHAREALEAAYAADGSDEHKRALKRRLFGDLREAYAELRASWSGDTSYDAWMAADLNNAKLASVSTYHDHVGAFRSILAWSGDDLAAFYEAAERLAAMPPEQRNACLNELAVLPRERAPEEPDDCAGVLVR